MPAWPRPSLISINSRWRSALVESPHFLQSTDQRYPDTCLISQHLSSRDRYVLKVISPPNPVGCQLYRTKLDISHFLILSALGAGLPAPAFSGALPPAGPSRGRPSSRGQGQPPWHPHRTLESGESQNINDLLMSDYLTGVIAVCQPSPNMRCFSFQTATFWLWRAARPQQVRVPGEAGEGGPGPLQAPHRETRHPARQEVRIYSRANILWGSLILSLLSGPLWHPSWSRAPTCRVAPSPTPRTPGPSWGLRQTVWTALTSRKNVYMRAVPTDIE